MQQLEMVELAFDDIQTNVGGFTNCRKAHAQIEDIKESLRNDGLLAPLTVWFRDEEPKHILVSGYLRHQSIKELRAETAEGEEMPFELLHVSKFTGTLTEAMAINVTENLHRENLNGADRAEAVFALVDRLGTQQAVADLLHKSQPWVSLQCSLITNLVPEALLALRNGQINLRQAQLLAKYVNKAGQILVEKQLAALDAILNGKAADPQERKRNYRLKKEVEDLRVQLADNEQLEAADIFIDGAHKASMEKFVRWFFCEIDTDELLLAPDGDGEDFEFEHAETKERIRI